MTTYNTSHEYIPDEPPPGLPWWQHAILGSCTVVSLAAFIANYWATR